MTLPATPFRKDHTGNDVATNFLYDWKILSNTHLKVVEQVLATGIERTLVLGVDYSVTGVGNDGGGNVVYGVPTAPLPSTKKITILPNVPYEQDTDFTNQNSVLPEEAEGMADKLGRQIKQLAEIASRSVTLPPTSTDSPENYITTMNEILADTQEARDDAQDARDSILNDPGFIIVAGDLLGSDTIGTVAADIAKVNIVSTNIANVNTVGTNIASVNTVSTNMTSVNTVAGAIANVNTVAGAIAAVNTVSTNITAVNTVSTNIAAVNTVSTNIAAVQNASTNMAAIIDAPNQAAAAAASAAAAAASAAEGLYNEVITLTSANSPYVPSAAQEGYLFRIDTTSGAVIVNLSTLATYNEDMKFGFVKVNAGANNITINRGGSDTINGATNIVLSTQYETHVLVGDQATATWLDTVQSTGIADDSVTNAKLTNMAQATIKGRASGAGTGDPVDLTAAQVRTIIGNATDTQVGLIEKATSGEMTAGTADVYPDCSITKTFVDASRALPANRTAMPAAVDTTITVPANAKRITIWLDDISNNDNTNGVAGDFVAQLKNSAYVTTGYKSTAMFPGVSGTNRTDGLAFMPAFGTGGMAANTCTFKLELELIDAATNRWMMTGVGGSTSSAVGGSCQGTVTLTTALTELRLRCINGTGAWDAGSYHYKIEI